MASYVGYAVLPGRQVRRLCRRVSPVAAMQYARTMLRPGEYPSVNRDDVLPPSIRASEIAAGVGDPMSKDEAVKKSLAWTRACLAGARAAKKEKAKW